MEEKKKVKVKYVRNQGNHLKIVQPKAETGIPVVDDIVNQPPSRSDPNGSYTGNPLNSYEVPVQDADDL